MMVAVIVCCCCLSSVIVLPVHADTIDAFHLSLELSTGSTTWSKSDYSQATLDTFTNAVCNALKPYVEANNGLVRCFIDYEVAPIIGIHVMATTSAEGNAYLTQQQLVGWTTSSGFANPLQTVQQLAFSNLNIPAISVQFSTATLRNPCRSEWSTPGATTRAPVPPLVCQDLVTVPTAWSFAFRTNAAINTVTARRVIWLTVVLPDSPTCTVEADCLTVTAASSDNPLWYNVVFQPALSNKQKLFTNFVHSVRYATTATLNEFGIVEVSLRANDMLSRTYIAGENVSPNAPPPFMYCNPFYDYWAFILLILGPILYIILRQSYHAGKKKGIQEEKAAIESEQAKFEEQERVEDEVAEMEVVGRRQDEMMMTTRPEGVTEEQYRQMMLLFFQQQQQLQHQQQQQQQQDQLPQRHTSMRY